MIVQYNLTDKHMDSRIFGKELTNLMGQDLKHQKNASFIHQEKIKEQSFNLQKHHAKQPTQSELLEEVKKFETNLDKTDPQLAHDYFLDNLDFLRKQERQTHDIKNYIPLQSNISEVERAKLIDWLSKIHYKYKMFPETLFTIVSVVDKYLSIKETSLRQLQLVGVAALYLAAKFQETYQVPPIKQLVSCCAFQYNSKEILAKQTDIIYELKFNLIITSIYKFFEPYSKIIGLETKNKHLAHYILELSLLQARFLNYAPSLMAASVIYLIKKIRKSESPWTPAMGLLLGYEQKELKTCAKQLCSLLEQAPEMQHAKSIKEKFSQLCFHEVTKIKLERKDKK